MAKFRKIWQALTILIARPWMLNLILENPMVYRWKIEKKYGKSMGLPQIGLDQLFPGFEIQVDPYAFLDGSSWPIDLALLKALAMKGGVEDYLEIGTWRGESVANVASVVKNCYTLNLPDEQVANSGNGALYVASHRFFSRDLPNVTHLFGDSASFDFEGLGKKFDMIFIDGDHHYEAVKRDTARLFSFLKSDDSMIVWHDYAASPETIRWDVMMGILDGCPPDKRQHLYHVSNTLCALYMKNAPASYRAIPYELPARKFSLDIRMEKVD
ncbi:MAG: class I SAM-dependent methyltransferase [Bacteroidales bacterium]|nr:class I SAM-dependent methyltransferase [Bacteroidales bacterium]